MARTVPAGVDTHLGDARSTVFHLIELIGTTTTYRYTDAPIAVTYGGNTYSNISFTLGDFVVDGDGELSTSVTFEDASRTIRTLAFSENLAQFAIKAWEVWADAENTFYGADLIFHGMCDGVRCEREDSPEPVATIAVRGVYGASAQGIGPTQEYSRTCRYKQFKGVECKYAGAATTCDRSYATCQSYRNQVNFGGFRFALDPGTTIQWGSNEPQPVEQRYSPPYEPSPAPSGNTGATSSPVPKRRSAGGR